MGCNSTKETHERDRRHHRILKWKDQITVLRHSIENLEKQLERKEFLRQHSIELFEEWDVLHSARIDIREFPILVEDLFVDLGFKPEDRLSPRDIVRGFQKLDKDHDGVLEITEFYNFAIEAIHLTIIKKEREIKFLESKVLLSDFEMVREIAGRIFATFDYGGAGVIKTKQFAAAAAEFCHDAQLEPPPLRVVKHVLKSFKSARPHRLNIDEFISILLRTMRIAINPLKASELGISVSHSAYSPPHTSDDPQAAGDRSRSKSEGKSKGKAKATADDSLSMHSSSSSSSSSS